MEQGASRALLHSLSIDSESPPNFGNPSSVHWAGRKAKSALDGARDSIAIAFGIEDSDEICFTASATESINTALKGFYFHCQAGGNRATYISSEVEHEATLETLRFLQSLGAEVQLLPVNERGELSLQHLESALEKAAGPAMVSLMAANNETGVIFPWEEAGKLAARFKALFHLDAVQAPGKIPGFTLAQSSADLVSLSAHKIGGPKGVGALVVRRGVKLESLMHGGAQERKRRAGTVNVSGIVSFAAAAEALASRDLSEMDALRAFLEKEVKSRIPGTHIQGEGAARLVNTSNFLFDAVRGESLLMGLDLEGFAVSSGSACNSGSILPSHVLLAMGLDKSAAQSAVRVSLGPENTREEISLFVSSLERVVGRIRASESSRVALRSPLA